MSVLIVLLCVGVGVILMLMAEAMLSDGRTNPLPAIAIGALLGFAVGTAIVTIT